MITFVHCTLKDADLGLKEKICFNDTIRYRCWEAQNEIVWQPGWKFLLATPWDASCLTTTLHSPLQPPATAQLCALQASMGQVPKCQWPPWVLTGHLKGSLLPNWKQNISSPHFGNWKWEKNKRSLCFGTLQDGYMCQSHSHVSEFNPCPSLNSLWKEGQLASSTSSTRRLTASSLIPTSLGAPSQQYTTPCVSGQGAPHLPQDRVKLIRDRSDTGAIHQSRRCSLIIDHPSLHNILRLCSCTWSANVNIRNAMTRYPWYENGSVDQFILLVPPESCPDVNKVCLLPEMNPKTGKHRLP